MLENCCRPDKVEQQVQTNSPYTLTRVLNNSTGSGLSSPRGEGGFPINHLFEEGSREFGDGTPSSSGYVNSQSDAHQQPSSAQQHIILNAKLHTQENDQQHSQENIQPSLQQEPIYENGPPLLQRPHRKKKRQMTKIKKNTRASLKIAS
jgi:hypothetical protein